MLRKSIAIFTVAAFVSIAAFPLYGMLLPGADQIVESENRAVSQFPADAALVELPAAFEAYFKDHFAFRREMVGVYNDIELMLGGSNDRVAYGRDGWMYYLRENSRQDIQRLNPYTQEQLELMCAAQQQTADKLAEMGTAYYLMFCPDKHTVYPEYLPEDLKVGEGDTRLDSLLKAMAQHTNIVPVDTRAAVIAAKELHQVYLKTDTHWNGYGAFAAYDVLAQRLEAEFPTFRRLQMEDCKFVETDLESGGDLAGMVGRADELKEARVNVYPQNATSVRLEGLPFREPSADPTRQSVVYENTDIPDAPTCVIFRDSFGSAIVPVLREGFSRTVVVWSEGVVEDVVRVEQPDVVIMEYVERLSGGTKNGIILAE